MWTCRRHEGPQRRPLLTTLSYTCVLDQPQITTDSIDTLYILQQLPDHERGVLTTGTHTASGSTPTAMDIPAHILEAVSTASDPQLQQQQFPYPPPARIPSAKSSLREKSSLRKSRSEPRFARSRSARSSVDNLSVSSESEQEHGYQTDFTSLPSEAPQDDMQPDDVEDFREREYPQLKGKTYLDHGGTTVCCCHYTNDLEAMY